MIVYPNVYTSAMIGASTRSLRSDSLRSISLPCQFADHLSNMPLACVARSAAPSSAGRTDNFRKRIVKTPKLYFYDVGLACRLLGIQEESQIKTHPLRGSLFENMVVTDLLKTRLNQGIDPSMFFWRDSAGLEIDLILENGSNLQPIEIKSGETFTASWLNNLNKWRSLAGNSSTQPTLCYGGNWTGQRSEVKVLPWHEIVQMNSRP